MAASADQIRKIITGLLRIQPNEVRKTSLMFGIMMCVVGSFIVARIARDSLFLSRYPIEYLPHLYIWVALGVSIQSYFYSRIADRFRRDKLFLITICAGLLVFVGARLALVWVGDWFYPVLYVLVELYGSIMIIQSWTLANDVFTTREAKRLFGLVGTGGVASSVVVGFFIRSVVKWVGTPELLVLCAFALVCCLFLVLRLSQACQEELVNAITGVRREMRSRIAFFSDWKRIFSNRHLVFVAGLVMVLVFVMTLVDYQFKVVARAAYPGQEDHLASFFGLFYGLTGILNVFIQALATSRILERFGILVSLLLLPFALLGGSIAWLIAPALWSVCMLKGADTTLRYTVNDATVQLLYLPVSPHIRGRAKAFIDGIIRPLSIALAGVGLVWILPRLPANALGWVLMFLLLLWIGMTFSIKKEYLQSLVKTLRARRLNFDADSSLVPDQAATQALVQALEDTNERNVLHALDMIQYTARIDWGEPLVRLVKHPSIRIRTKAVRLLGRQGSLQHGPVVYSCLRDSNPAVLAAAIQAYCSIGKERAVRTIALFLEHEDPDVRSAAVVGLIRYGGLDGVLSSAAQLKTMLENEHAEERAAGAKILGEIQVKNFYHPLLELMADDDLAVRLSAIRAAGCMKSPELLPAVIYRLETPPTRSAAVEALVAMGAESVKLLQRALSNPKESLAIRSVIPSILARIGDQAALDALLEQINDPAASIRNRVLEGIHRLRIHKPHLRLDREKLRQSLLKECSKLYAYSLANMDLQPQVGPLLADALSRRLELSIRRAFRFLGCLFPVRAVDMVWANLASPNRATQANALEVIDNMMDTELKRLILPLLDNSLRDDLIEIGRESYQLTSQPLRDHLTQLIQEEDSWLATCAAYEVSQSNLQGSVELLQSRAKAEDPILRETVLLSLSRLTPQQHWKKILESFLKDSSQQVRNLASSLLGQHPV